MDWRLSHLDWESWGGGKKNCSMKSFQDLVCPGHYKVTMGHHLLLRSPKRVSKALGITYYLHCAWKPQSSGKIERASQFLKSAIKKITQETSLRWKETLPIAFLCTHIAPKEQIGLSPYEIWETFCLCQWPLPRSRVSDSPVLYHGHWSIPKGYRLVGVN